MPGYKSVSTFLRLPGQRLLTESDGHTRAGVLAPLAPSPVSRLLCKPLGVGPRLSCYHLTACNVLAFRGVILSFSAAKEYTLAWQTTLYGEKKKSQVLFVTLSPPSYVSRPSKCDSSLLSIFFF